MEKPTLALWFSIEASRYIQLILRTTMYKHLFVFLSSLFIFSCSTGEENDFESTHTITVNVKKNITKNASATASYDTGNSGLVIDSDSTGSNFWSGNIPGDNLTIDIGKTYEIAQIIVHTNETSIWTTSPPVTYELSPDGENWSETLLLSGGDIPCTYEFSISSGKIVCKISRAYSNIPAVEQRYFRITVNSDNVGLIQFYEVEITGWVEETTVID